MTLYKWSQTASADATADATINWAEGQAPSSINDSARAMMAATAKYRDDIAGSLVTTGTSTAYLLTSNQSFDTLAHLSGQMVAFTPHATNGPTVTLNIDSLGAKPLRSAPNVELLAGTIIQGTPYIATYNNVDGAFYLKGFYGNPYNVPLGASLDFWLPTAPNSSFAFLNGAPISRAIYATLFAVMGTTFGAGDGSTTFNIPDCRGRVVACPDIFGGSGDPNRLTSGALAGVRNSLGGAGGESGHTLSVSELPTGINSSGSNNITVASQNGQTGIPTTTAAANVTQASVANGSSSIVPASSSASWGAVNSLAGANAISVTSNNTGGNAHNVMQPTILAYRILRII